MSDCLSIPYPANYGWVYGLIAQTVLFCGHYSTRSYFFIPLCCGFQKEEAHSALINNDMNLQSAISELVAKGNNMQQPIGMNMGGKLDFCPIFLVTFCWWKMFLFVENVCP